MAAAGPLGWIWNFVYAWPLLAWLAARDDAERLRVHLLLNKADQIGRAERARAQAQAEHRAESLPMPVSVQLFSGLNREGLDELRTTLSQVVEG
jgi:GTP-binding protein